jgi:hypothetical protein
VPGAADFWTNYDTDPILNQNFSKIVNTPEFIPQEGDVAIWNRKMGAGFGHIAVCTGVGKPVATTPITTKGYTVATLPTGVQGDVAFVTDATSPTFLGSLTGGGAVVTPVFYNGTSWVSY